MQGQAGFGRRGAGASLAAATAAPGSDIPVSDAVAPDMASDDDRPFTRIPWASLALLALLSLAFLLEVTDAPDIAASRIGLGTLVHLGAVSRDLVFRDGQAWRLLTAPWLHGNTAHIVGNGLTLLMIGLLLEPIVGWRWFVAVYAVGGLAGSFGSMALSDGSVASVGASGAIMALMTFAVTVALHPASTGRRRRIWIRCAIAGGPALLATSATASSVHVDYGAHVGGAILGFIAGYLLLITWSAHRRRPPLQRAAALAALAVSAVGLGSVGVAAALPAGQVVDHGTAGLIPAVELPNSEAEGERRATELVVVYPKDPRGHMLMALQLSRSGSYSEAEQEVQKALASPLLHAPEIPADMEQHMRVLLLADLIEQRDYYGARQAAEALCPAKASLDGKVQEAIKQLKACDEAQ